MSAQNPQVFEPHLDLAMAGTLTEPEALKGLLRALYVTRRRYNDPDQVAGRKKIITPSGWAGDYEQTSSNTCQGRLGGVEFSSFWSVDSQKTRVEQGIAFLVPIVGTAVGDYPPIPLPADGATHWRFDSMGNQIPPGKP